MKIQSPPTRKDIFQFVQSLIRSLGDSFFFELQLQSRPTQKKIWGEGLYYCRCNLTAPCCRRLSSFLRAVMTASFGLIFWPLPSSEKITLCSIGDSNPGCGKSSVAPLAFHCQPLANGHSRKGHAQLAARRSF